MPDPYHSAQLGLSKSKLISDRSGGGAWELRLLWWWVPGACLIMPGGFLAMVKCASLVPRLEIPGDLPPDESFVLLFLLALALGPLFPSPQGEVTSVFLATCPLGLFLPSLRWSVDRGRWGLLSPEMSPQDDLLLWICCREKSPRLGRGRGNCQAL